MTDKTEYSVEDIATRLCSYLNENILAGDVDVNMETELVKIGIDSFSLMEMILFIERSFGLVLPAESLTPENIASIGSISTYCATLLKQADG
ncbi:MAG: phosphopantetheine-binding protein [Methylococcaceae bacterium]|nr:phosphopantetheine-binding protein [Methylococcaceae bacterium]